MFNRPIYTDVLTLLFSSTGISTKKDLKVERWKSRTRKRRTWNCYV